MTAPLISPKPFAEFGEAEYHEYVSSMYALPVKRGSVKPKSPVSGLTVSRSKKGQLTVRRTAKQRPFAYATLFEIRALAEHVKCSQADLWQLLKSKDYILAPTRMECETIYAQVNEIPWRNE